MTLQQLFEGLAEKGLRIWAHEGGIRYRGPRGALTEELRAELRAHKQGIIALLKGGGGEPTSPGTAGLQQFRAAVPSHARPRSTASRHPTLERSITAWLQDHAPEVAALWPDAPMDAGWYDWRCHVPEEHTSTLDRALEHVQEVSRRDIRALMESQNSDLSQKTKR